MKLNKIEQNKAAKDGLDVGPEIDTFAQLGWENVDKTDLELRLKWYGMFWRPKTPGKFMLRLRVPNGVLLHQDRRMRKSRNTGHLGVGAEKGAKSPIMQLKELNSICYGGIP